MSFISTTTKIKWKAELFLCFTRTAMSGPGCLYRAGELTKWDKGELSEPWSPAHTPLAMCVSWPRLYLWEGRGTLSNWHQKMPRTSGSGLPAFPCPSLDSVLASWPVHELFPICSSLPTQASVQTAFLSLSERGSAPHASSSQHLSEFYIDFKEY